ncbi:MAG: hypothetical protein HYS17_04955 [Micavibrio aeruginosavorus]|uniref:DUF1554 domain-containing protein n=1 Tax=Micavibrio aeruginosavorus TaxID=349221 RepID=A0A7T5UHB2_9BACT|nr:MAG: hypothetical protein HYS17_04955 [Micavibrio aeruginosavorus]
MIALIKPLCKHTLFNDFITIALVVFIALPPAQVKAEISGNFGQGAIKIGPASDICDGLTVGSIRWNSVDKVHEFCNETNWTRVVPDCSAWPDDFSFPPVTNAPASATQASSIEEITGISCSSADVSVTGDGSPSFRVCSDSSCNAVVQDWTSTTSPVANNQYLQLRLTSSGNSLGIYAATVTVGGQSRNWSVTTQELGTFKYTFGVPADSAIGGITGADTLCASAASAAGLGGTYMAWLATDETDDPDSRFTTKAVIPYRGTDGALVANNWTDLTDGTVSVHPGRKSAAGDWIASGAVISNVSPGGAAINSGIDNCAGWTTNGSGYSGRFGTTGSTNTGWTSNSTMGCSGYRVMVCIQQ